MLCESMLLQEAFAELLTINYIVVGEILYILIGCEPTAGNSDHRTELIGFTVAAAVCFSKKLNYAWQFY